MSVYIPAEVKNCCKYKAVANYLIMPFEIFPFENELYANISHL